MTTASEPVPRLVGVVHLAPLPGSPRFGRGDTPDLAAVERAAVRDAQVLAEAGFPALIIENFGDAPFEPGEVPPVTVAAMTRVVLAVRAAAPACALGINVLRNDARAALAIAVACEATFIRVNVHIGARVTDQGIIEGRAHDTLRQRRALGAEHVRLFCDVGVKHSAPLGVRSLAEETADLVERASADAVLVTGTGTGRGVHPDDLAEVRRATTAPILVASGATPDSIGSLADADGFIVGSAVREGGRAGAPVVLSRARAFVEAFTRFDASWRSRGSA